MYETAHDLKTFYTSETGRVVRRILHTRIAELWPDARGLEILGLGYSIPYMKPFQKTASRTIAMMSDGLGVHHWPNKPQKNLTGISSPSDIPLATEATDRILMLHHLEYIQTLKPCLKECWRILKPTGRMLVVVPNRLGFWSRADWSPFGHGRPFNLMQITHYLKDNGFVIEQTEEALFMPPTKLTALLKAAPLCEAIGRRILPIVSGVHIIEVSKQVYAKTNVVQNRQKIKSPPFFAKPAS